MARPYKELRDQLHKDRQNGSRLGGHRKLRVSPESWMILIGVIAAVFALGATLTEGQEYKPYNQGTGLIVADTELCFSPNLNSESIKLLGVWQRAVDAQESYERGGPAVEEELAITAQLLHANHICATVAAFYRVTIIRHVEGYALASFDPSLIEQFDFDTGTFIVARKDIIPDRGI
jgi:hypothetical protein